ncbi:hypothetical protein KC660_03535 [Candidatus Dojkabacteria bacterium]|uniref:Translation initiation factor eIF-2B n=1 Tax=Candidatus Dojkabacteria bacterium TaxID=2099670 RepID=A0A955RI60_9BACT|nr:hypothetical protein [Candidatus Dojkabacteria bacterium]
MNDLSSIKQIFEDIRSVKVQGATNVAKAVANGMLTFSKAVDENYSDSKKQKRVFEIGHILAEARPNEPLARNAVLFLEFSLAKQKKEKGNEFDFDKEFDLAIDQFFDLLEASKRDMVNSGIDFLKDKKVFLTHCHSSSVENIFKGLNLLDNKIKVYSTETRPLYQGRITSANLFQAKIDVTLITDNAAAAIITGTEILPDRKDNVEAVLIGCDEMSMHGDVINKVGSLQIALAAREAKIPLFVVSTLLKINTDWSETEVPKAKIEQRDGDEVWSDAPKGLKILNPAFDIIDRSYFEGYITEAGVVKEAKLTTTLKKKFTWLK